MNILITTPWRAQGLAVLSFKLRTVLRELGHSVRLHAWRGNYEPMGHDVDIAVSRAPFKRRAAWADCVIWPETIEPGQVAWCRELGKRTIWIPMWEQVRPSVQPIWDAIVCPTACSYEMFRDWPGSVHCQWWMPMNTVEARPTPGRPRFLHMRGGKAKRDRSGSDTVLDAFRLYRAAGGPGSLTVKSLKPFNAPGINVICDRLSYADTQALYDSADMLLQPAQWEGVGLTIIEALAYSVPVITSDAPPMNEWIDDGVNGYLAHGKFDGRFNQVPAFYASSQRVADLMLGADFDNLKARCLDTHAIAGVDFRLTWRGILGCL